MNYYHIPAEELGSNANIPIQKLSDSGEVFYEMALEMIREIKGNNLAGNTTVLICPVGPVGQYPIFVRIVNCEGISLKNVWFINMDEYLNDDETWIEKLHPLSFRGYMERNVYDKIDGDLIMPREQRIFPDPANLTSIPKLIEELGGVDIAFGGIGINGHLAFNEPQEELSIDEFSRLSTRILTISPETRTANGIGDLGGAIEAMPKKCVTIGISEILSARKIRLGVFRDWHRAVVRRAAYSEVSTGFPVTLCQRHPDSLIIANANAAKLPF